LHKFCKENDKVGLISVIMYACISKFYLQKKFMKTCWLR